MSPDARQVFLIGCGPNGSAHGSAEVMGFKAFNLARMARVGIAVPAAFVLGTRHCAEFLARGGTLSEETRAQIRSCTRRLEEGSGLGLGSPRRPLILSVRAGAPVSMPGMLDTMLNVGLCDSTMPGLLRLTGNPRLAWDCYRRFVKSFAEVVRGAGPEPFERAMREELQKSGQELKRVHGWIEVRHAYPNEQPANVAGMDWGAYLHARTFEGDVYTVPVVPDDFNPRPNKIVRPDDKPHVFHLMREAEDAANAELPGLVKYIESKL